MECFVFSADLNGSEARNLILTDNEYSECVLNVKLVELFAVRFNS